MTNQNGPERRKELSETDQLRQDVSDTRTDIAIIKNCIIANHESLRRSIDNIEQHIIKHEHTLYGNEANGTEGQTSKVRGLEKGSRVYFKTLNDHVLSDRWAFGIVFGFQLAILLKLYWPH